MEPGTWVDFSFEICNQIQQAYQEKKKDFQFSTEPNVQSIVWFEEMIYNELTANSIQSYKVERYGK